MLHTGAIYLMQTVIRFSRTQFANVKHIARKSGNLCLLFSVCAQTTHNAAKCFAAFHITRVNAERVHRKTVFITNRLCRLFVTMAGTQKEGTKNKKQG